MKMALIIVMAIAVLLLPVSYAHAMRAQSAFMYGKSCYSPYGYSKKNINVMESMEIIGRYFADRGLEVKMLKHDRRFVHVEVYKGDEKVDRIIVDVKTGRMRSVY
jgi:hypothetical protein